MPLDEAKMRAAAPRPEGGGREGGRRLASSTASSAPSTRSARCRSCARRCPTPSSRAGHEIAPEFREYERLSTVVLNAYLGPVMRRLHRAARARGCEALGMTATPHLTQSNGGVIGFATAAEMPVRTVLSGPSTGVVGAQAIGRAGGLRGPHHLRHGRHLDRRGAAAGRPLPARRRGRRCTAIRIKAPMLDIHTVGAGGGSIAYIDSGGLLKVGPALAPAPIPARSATARATRSPPSPTPTSCCRR